MTAITVVSEGGQHNTRGIASAYVPNGNPDAPGAVVIPTAVGVEGKRIGISATARRPMAVLHEGTHLDSAFDAAQREFESGAAPAAHSAAPAAPVPAPVQTRVEVAQPVQQVVQEAPAIPVPPVGMQEHTMQSAQPQQQDHRPKLRILVEASTGERWMGRYHAVEVNAKTIALVYNLRFEYGDPPLTPVFTDIPVCQITVTDGNGQVRVLHGAYTGAMFVHDQKEFTVFLVTPTDEQ